MADLTALALNAARSLSVAELHGAACGLTAGGSDSSLVQDMVDLLGADALTDFDSVELFVSESVSGLLAEDLSFMPLLPDEDAPLADRVAALAEWCGSFLAGLAVGLARIDEAALVALPLEVQEIVQDFTAITEIDIEDLADTGSDGQEADYAQLQEFVKIGVLLVLSVLTSEPDDQTD